MEAVGVVEAERDDDHTQHGKRTRHPASVQGVDDRHEHRRSQDRQRDRIYRVHEYLRAGAPGTLDTMFQGWFAAAETDAERERVIVDQIASMTESRLERTAKKAAAFEGFI